MGVPLWAGFGPKVSPSWLQDKGPCLVLKGGRYVWLPHVPPGEALWVPELPDPISLSVTRSVPLPMASAFTWLFPPSAEDQLADSQGGCRH